MSNFASALLAQASDGSAVGFSLFAGTGLILLLLILLASIFWIWMLVDCLMSNLPPTEKLIWVLVIFFLHLLGAILYFAIARGNRRIAT